MTKKGLVNFRL